MALRYFHTKGDLCIMIWSQQLIYYTWQSQKTWWLKGYPPVCWTENSNLKSFQMELSIKRKLCAHIVVHLIIYTRYNFATQWAPWLAQVSLYISVKLHYSECNDRIIVYSRTNIKNITVVGLAFPRPRCCCCVCYVLPAVVCVGRRVCERDCQYLKST